MEKQENRKTGPRIPKLLFHPMRNQQTYLFLCFLIMPSCVGIGQRAAMAQPSLPVTEQAELRLIEGILDAVVDSQIVIRTAEGEWPVRVSETTPIGLQLNQPWFDWEHQRVYVTAVSVEPSDLTRTSHSQRPPFDTAKHQANESATRISFDFPAADLHVITRFQRKGRLQKFLDQGENRLGFYLVTPEDVGQHFPTMNRPFMAGPIRGWGEQNQITLEINGTPVLARLGFQTGTMNGFSVRDLIAKKTWVILSATSNDQGQLVANSILFFPIALKD